jgi:SAM-dependent methyltransferase
MFQLMEIALADTHRLYQYKLTGGYPIDFGVKGFDNGWVLASHTWKNGEAVLDVGGAYSELPIYIQKTYGCKVWVVDDFGMDTGGMDPLRVGDKEAGGHGPLAGPDPFWMRNRSPQEHIANHPEVDYVLERVGDPQRSSLPLGYFDMVYSVSVLEHVPYAMTSRVWQHLGALVKPGGELLHAIDIPFPSNGGLSKILKAILFDTFCGLLPYNFRLSHFLATPQNYASLASKALGVPGGLPDRLKANIGVLRMSLDPEVVTEPLEFGYNRIVKDKMVDYRFLRTGSLLLRYKKLGHE